MIKINNVEFIIEKVKISYGKFSVSIHGFRKQGISPYISFYINDNFGNKNVLSVETTYPTEYFKTLKLNKEVDFSRFISDIIYTKNGVWDSLITGKYTSRLIKLDKNKCKIILQCYYENLDYIFDLNLEEIIEL